MLSRRPFPLMTLVAAGLCATAPLPARAQSAAWQDCVALADAGARLACFDRWAGQQAASTPAVPPAPPAPAPEPPPVQSLIPATRVITVGEQQPCRDRQYSALSRFWELEAGTDCGTFGIRGFRPISLSLIGSNGTNTQPSSANPANSASSALPYRATETRIQLSVRTKLAQGLLTRGDPTLRDSLWFAYTQQSYWQLFTGTLSRPFRSTDHEPEVIYALPLDAPLPAGWRLRYGSLGVVHQSNGQSLPLSRSWNRAYLGAGMELDNRATLQARIWKRLPEKHTDDDNPDISAYIGRAEVTGTWNIGTRHTLGATVRHALSRPGRGSLRLEWLEALGEPGTSDLRLHVQLFSGYGDSLLDYNRRRTVLSVGMSLVDW